MKCSPLKFSLGVSLAIHGIAIGGALLSWRHQSDGTTKVSEATTLELVAAPSSPERAIDRMFAPVIPPPPQPEIQAVIPEKPTALPTVEVVVLPQPTPLPEPITVAVATVAIVTTPQNTMPPERGDNSSALPGRDVTTVEGKPTAKAEPDYLKNPEPEYPLAARRRGQEGLVLLNVTVSGAGRATEISLKQSTGYELLDQAAIKAVREWEFEPARIGSVGVESKIEVPVRFRLNR